MSKTPSQKSSQPSDLHYKARPIVKILHWINRNMTLLISFIQSYIVSLMIVSFWVFGEGWGYGGMCIDRSMLTCKRLEAVDLCCCALPKWNCNVRILLFLCICFVGKPWSFIYIVAEHSSMWESAEYENS